MAEDQLTHPIGIDLAIDKFQSANPGSTGNPAIGFLADQTVGWYINESSEVVFTSGAVDNIVQNAEFTEFKNPILINALEPVASITDDKGYLFKKVGDAGLWWRTSAGDVDLTHVIPIGLAFNQVQNTAVDNQVQVQDTVQADNTGITTFDTSLNTNTVNLKVAVEEQPVNTAQEQGPTEQPANTVEPVARVSIEQTNTLELVDAIEIPDPTIFSGHLFKKIGDPNLWWKTTDGEINLTEKLKPEPSLMLNPTLGIGQSLTGLNVIVDEIPVAEFSVSNSQINVPINLAAGLNVGCMTLTTDGTSLSIGDTGIEILNASMQAVTVPNKLTAGSVSIGNVDLHTNGKFLVDIDGETALECSNDGLTVENMNTKTMNIDGIEIYKDTDVKFDLDGKTVLTVGKSLSTDNIETKKLSVNEVSVGPAVIKGTETELVMEVGGKSLKYDGSKLSMLGASTIINFNNTNYLASASDGLAISSDQASMLIKDKIVLVGNTEVTGDLKIGSGVLNGLNNLTWKVGDKTVDLCDRSSVLVADGCLNNPSMSFESNKTVGLALMNGKLASIANGRVVTAVSNSGLDVNGNINLANGSIYSDGASLMWKTSSDLVDLTNLQVKFPLNVSVGQSIMFDKFNLRSDGSQLYLGDKVSIGSTANFDVPIKIREQYDDVPEDKAYGYLYKEKNTQDLIWNANGTKMNLTKKDSNLVVKHNGTGPDISFEAEPTTGLSCDGKVSIVVKGNTNLSVDENVNVKNKLILAGSQLANVNGDLYWRSTNLTKPITSLSLNNGSLESPSINFLSNLLSGIYNDENGIGVVVDGDLSTKFTADGLSTNGITLGASQLKADDGKLYFNGVDISSKTEAVPCRLTADTGLAFDGTNLAVEVLGGKVLNVAKDLVSTDRLAVKTLDIAGGSLTYKNNKLEFYGLDGTVSNLNSNVTTFTGGRINDALITPAVVVGSHEIVELQGELNIMSNGQPSVTVSTDGIASLGYSFINSNLSINSQTTVDKTHISIRNESKEYLRIDDLTTKLSGSLTMKSGELANISDSLIWRVGDKTFDLTKPDTEYPLNVVGDVGLKWKNCNVSADENGLILNSGTGQTRIVDGNVVTSKLHTGLIDADAGLIVSLSTVDGSSVVTTLTDTQLEIPGVFRGKSDAVTFGYDLDNSIGMKLVSDHLGFETGNEDPVEVSNDLINLHDRSLVLKDISIRASSDDLVVNVKGADYSLLNSMYKPYLYYKCAEPIKRGDIVCVDDNGQIQKGIGGYVSDINVGNFTGSNKSMGVFNYGTSFIFAYTSTTDNNLVARFSVLDKVNCNLGKRLDIVVDYVEGFVYSKILKLSDTVYVIVYFKKGDDFVTIKRYNNLFNKGSIDTLQINLGVTCENMTVYHDGMMLVIVCYGGQQFNIGLVSCEVADVLAIGTIEHHPIMVADVDKQIHLVAIPGGTYVISYGILKLAFATSNYLGNINIGEPFMDYESIDCIDMLYDSLHGSIITLEKTIADSCYIQVLDVLGINIQKICSKGFNGATIDPIGIAYNKTADDFIIVYSDTAKVFTQQFAFDGEIITIGLRYVNKPATKWSKIESVVFEIPDTKFYLYGYEPNSLVRFETGYHGYPVNYIGIADEDSSGICRVIIKNHIYYNDIKLSWVGKKIYLVDPNAWYPNCFDTKCANGILFGTCLDSNRILLQ